MMYQRSRQKKTINRYLQLTFNVTVVSRRWPSGMARFHTTQRYFAPSSSFCGVIDNVLVVWRSFDPPRLTGACTGIVLPSRYQLKKKKKMKINDMNLPRIQNQFDHIWAISIFHFFRSICLLTVTWRGVMYIVILGGKMSHWNYSSFDANQFVIEANEIKHSDREIACDNYITYYD